MIFDRFKIRIQTSLNIEDANCKCGTKLVQVSNGFLGSAMYCPTCENVYILKLIKAPAKQVTESFLKQCRKECHDNV